MPPQQQQQPFGMSNNPNNLNVNGMMGFPNTNSSQENQLYDSIRMAVSLGYISADLFNSQLPSEVLNLLNQLFDKLTQLLNVNNRMNALKRKTTIQTPQFKTEMDLLNQESQNLKDNLTILKSKINLAHMQLKQQQQNMNAIKIGKPNMLNNNLSNVPLVTTPPAVSNGPLSSSSSASNNMGFDVMSSLLGSQLNELSLKDAQSRPKPFTNDSNPMSQMNRQSQNPFSSYSSPSPVINNWSGLSLGDNLGLDQQAIDDGVIPFVPGKIWAGTGPSVEDDPNCTPGSVSRPLLTGAIDPESILGSLQRNGQWSNKPFDLSNSLNSSMGSHLGNQLGSVANSTTNRQGRNNSGAWSSNSNNYMTQMSMPASSNNNANINGSISEQLWGVRGGNNGNNRMGNSNQVNNQLNSNSLLNNRNSSMINTNNGNNSLLSQQQQQQFFRSNSWNMNSQQPQMNLDNNRNSSMSNNSNNNFNLNNGHFILIRNVTQQVSIFTF
jgi:hypothetical protein